VKNNTNEKEVSTLVSILVLKIGGDYAARHYASAVYGVVVCLSIRPSVRPSQAGIVPIWLILGSCKQCRTIAQDSSFLMPKISVKF